MGFGFLACGGVLMLLPLADVVLDVFYDVEPYTFGITVAMAICICVFILICFSALLVLRSDSVLYTRIEDEDEAMAKYRCAKSIWLVVVIVCCIASVLVTFSNLGHEYVEVVYTMFNAWKVNNMELYEVIRTAGFVCLGMSLAYFHSKHMYNKRREKTLQRLHEKKKMESENSDQ
jgi:hypothetical protein